MSSSSQIAWADVVDSSSPSSACDSDCFNDADISEQTASESTSLEYGLHSSSNARMNRSYCAGQSREEANKGSKDIYLMRKLKQIVTDNSQPGSNTSCSSTDSKGEPARKNRKARRKTAAHRHAHSDDQSDTATSNSLGTDSSSLENSLPPVEEVWMTPEAAAQSEAEADAKMAARLGPERWATEKTQIPKNRHGYLTSWGSRFHNSNPDDCKPCLFQVSPSGCRAGIVCQFCHMPHERSGKTRPCKKKRDRFKKHAEQLEQMMSGMPEDEQNDVVQLEQIAENMLSHSRVDSEKKARLAKKLVSFTRQRAHNDSGSATSAVEDDQANAHSTKLSL